MAGFPADRFASELMLESANFSVMPFHVIIQFITRMTIRRGSLGPTRIRYELCVPSLDRLHRTRHSESWSEWIPTHR